MIKVIAALDEQQAKDAKRKLDMEKMNETVAPPSFGPFGSPINELAAALAKAQAEIQNAKKDSENPFFKSKYADLSAVWDACRGPLTKNGLSIVQIPYGHDGKYFLNTILMHSSGQFLSGILPVVPIKGDPQALGSALTYMRRYALSAMVGNAPEDDDGNEASGKDTNNKGGFPKPKRRSPTSAVAAWAWMWCAPTSSASAARSTSRPRVGPAPPCASRSR